MNILYITNHLNTGGVSNYVLTLSCGLKKKGHNIFVASSGGELLERFLENGINYFKIPIRTKKEIGFKVYLSFRLLLKFVRENKIDIIHSNSRTTQVLACLLERKTSLAHVYTCHGFFRPNFTRKMFPCWGRKVIAVSEAVAENLTTEFKLAAQRVVMIHNGIDLERFSPALLDTKTQLATKQEFGLKGGPIIGIIGRLSDVKGHTYLIEAFKNILSAFPHAQLLIVGEGPMENRLKKFVKKNNLMGNTFFIPTVKETAGALSIMDVFVMPSLKEGLGLALMEAMASGLPVVGSNVGGIKNLIKDKVNGLLVEPENSKGIAEAILELLKNPDEAALLGKAARDFIRENFSQEKMVDLTEEEYLKCLKSTG